MTFRACPNDGFGFAMPAVDAHTLGVNAAARLLRDCGYRIAMADAEVRQAVGSPHLPRSETIIEQWLFRQRLTALGFSYRLDPDDGAEIFLRLLEALKRRRLLATAGGPLRGVFFAGLPHACRLVRNRAPDIDGVFCGDETPADTLRIFGVPPEVWPRLAKEGSAYDESRLAFGRDLVRSEAHRAMPPPNPRAYEEFGTARDSLALRLRHAYATAAGPVVRAHVGPYLADRVEAVKLFLDWCQRLARSGQLDVLSIGTSQLTQSHFGRDWDNLPNGGGVPLNSAAEFAAAWKASRPMLVRTYAGSREIAALARMYEETIHIAWHALSLWWFCRLDGRGPYGLRENLAQHVATLRLIAAWGTPFEANVAHHFAFRGSDDVTAIASAVLACRLAKILGIRLFVLQNMLNTPKSTWGLQDLAKARALLALTRKLEDDTFRVVLQPRGGLDYFSPDPEKAKAQLAAVTALMDDIEPQDEQSPMLVHVVSYSEASHLADPATVDESIQITRTALQRYRLLRRRGEIDNMACHPEVQERSAILQAEVRQLLHAMEQEIPGLHTADGFYQAFAQGFLPVPYLWECRDEFPLACQWQTDFVDGGVKLVDENGRPISMAERLALTLSRCRAARGK